MSGPLGAIIAPATTGLVNATAASVSGAAGLTVSTTLGPQPATPGTPTTPAMPATGSNVAVTDASVGAPGLGAPYAGLTGQLTAVAYATDGVTPIAAMIYFPTLAYTATFLTASIAVKATS